MPKVIDLTNQTFGALTVVSRAKNHVSSGGHSFTAWNCKCVCGRKTVVTSGHLTSFHTTSCGKCGFYDNSRDFTNTRVGMVTVIEKSDECYYYPNGEKDFKWVCRCDCGNSIVIRGNRIRDGIRNNHLVSCGCARKFKKIKDADMVYKTFGRLTVIKRADDYVGKDGKRVSCWLCECTCGNIIVVRGSHLKNGHTASCGCYRYDMLTYNGNAMSKAEIWTSKYLTQCSVEYVQQKCFPGLVGLGGHLLSYDFYLLQYDANGLLIECQGLQHYEPVKYFGGESAFKCQCEHDKRKRDYAKAHHIALVELNTVNMCENQLIDKLSLILKK